MSSTLPSTEKDDYSTDLPTSRNTQENMTTESSQDFSDLLEAFDICDLPKELDNKKESHTEKAGSTLATPTFDGSNLSSDDTSAKNVTDPVNSSAFFTPITTSQDVTIEKPTPKTQTTDNIIISPETANTSNTESVSTETHKNTPAKGVLSDSNSLGIRIDNVRSVEKELIGDESNNTNNFPTANILSTNLQRSPVYSDAFSLDKVMVKQEKLDTVCSSSSSSIINTVPIQVFGNTSSKIIQNRSLPASKALSHLVKVVENPSMTNVVKDSTISKFGEIQGIRPVGGPVVNILPQSLPAKSISNSCTLLVPVSMRKSILVQSAPAASTILAPSKTVASLSAQSLTVSNTDGKCFSNKIASNLFVMPSTEKASSSTHKITMRKVVIGGKTQMQSVTIGEDESMNTISAQSQKKSTNKPLGIKLDTLCEVLVRPSAVSVYEPPEPPAHIREIVKKFPRFKCVECGDTFLLESSWANHRRRRTCIITLDCSVCKKKIVSYNRCVLMAHLALDHHKGIVTLNDAYYQPLPKNLLKTVMDVQMELAPQKSVKDIIAGLPEFLNEKAEEKIKSTVVDINHEKHSVPMEQVSEKPLTENSHSKSIPNSVKLDVSSSNKTSLKQITPPTPDRGVTLRQKASKCKELWQTVSEADPNCAECGQKFKEHGKLSLHYSGIRRNGYFKYRCIDCCKYLPSGCALRAHLRLHKEEQPFVCPECGSLIPKLEVYLKHVKEFCCHYDRKVRLNCPKCKINIYSPNEFLDHLHDAHVELYLKCQCCPMAFRSHESIMKHAEKSHDTSKIVWKNIYKCPLCDTVFHDLRLINEHLRMHVPDKSNDPTLVYCCLKCNVDFISLNTYKYHNATEHNHNSIFHMCIYCGDSFKSLSLLEAHRKDDSESNLKCAICNMFMSDVDALREHKSQVHHSLKVSVETPRTSTCSNSPQLQPMEIEEVEVEEIKDVPKWIPCSECGHRYPTTESLQKHIELDHQTRISSMPCHMCGIVLSDNTALQKHIETVHIENKSKFVCHLCSKEGVMNMSFTKVSTLEKHLKSAHRLTRSLVDIDLFSVDAENPDDRIKRENSTDSDISFLPAKRIRVDGSGTYVCAKCTFAVDDREKFVDHITIHKTTDEESYQCQECGMSFVIKTALKRHLFMAHKIRNMKQYESDAGIDFDAPEIAKTMIINGVGNEIHRKDCNELSDPLECQVCHKLCTSDASLRTHMRSHGMAFIKSKSNNSSAHEAITSK